MSSKKNPILPFTVGVVIVGVITVAIKRATWLALMRGETWKDSRRRYVTIRANQWNIGSARAAVVGTYTASMQSAYSRIQILQKSKK